MSVFSLIGHLGMLIHMGKDIQGIIQNLVTKKESMPSSAEFHAVVDDVIELLNSGLLNLPPEVQKNMVDALKAAEAQIWPAPPAASN